MINEYIEFMKLSENFISAQNQLTLFRKKIEKMLEPYFYICTNCYNGNWEVKPLQQLPLINRLGYSFKRNGASYLPITAKYYIKRENEEKQEISDKTYTQVFQFLNGLHFDEEGVLQEHHKKNLILISFSDKERIKKILIEEYNKCFPKTKEQTQ